MSFSVNVNSFSIQISITISLITSLPVCIGVCTNLNFYLQQWDICLSKLRVSDVRTGELLALSVRANLRNAGKRTIETAIQTNNTETLVILYASNRQLVLNDIIEATILQFILAAEFKTYSNDSNRSTHCFQVTVVSRFQVTEVLSHTNINNSRMKE